MSEMPRVLTASAEIGLSCSDMVMQRLCAHFAEYGTVAVDGRCGRIETGFGTVAVEACERCLKVLAQGADDTALAYVKLAVAEHVLQFAIDETPDIVWTGDGAAGEPLPYFREMRVLATRDVTPRMRRVTLGGSNLGRFATGGLHVRLLFPKERDVKPTWPVTGRDGRPCWPEDRDRPDVRIYTIRRIDVARGEVDIDFVLHASDHVMPGADFGATARPGDLVGMTGPGGGSMGQADWYLLAGDETALPAIGRILEGLPAHATAIVRIEIADEAERQPLPSPASVDLQWIVRQDCTTNAQQLAEAVRAVEWPADGRSVFAWAGCEFHDFRAIRSYLRQERKLAREQHLVVAYWRRGYDGDNARKEA